MDSLLLAIDGAAYNALGLVFVTLGAVVTIRFLGFPDLTPDGSFTLGACVFARLVHDGWPEGPAVAGGFGVGLLCGGLTSLLNDRLKIGKLLSSVITMILAVSLAPYVLGRATIGLLDESLLLNHLAEVDRRISEQLLPAGVGVSIHLLSVAVIGAGCFAASALIARLARTRWGVAVRFLGSSLNPGPIVGRSAGRFTALALVGGNGLVALGGIIEAMHRGGADQGMGLGIVLTAVSSLIIGESVLRRLLAVDVLSPSQTTAAALLGTCAYSLLVQLVLIIGFPGLDIRVLTAVLLIAVLGFSHRLRGRQHELF